MDYQQTLVACIGETEVARALESDTHVIEGSVYFPPESVRFELLQESAVRTRCPWRGEAVYYDVLDGDRIIEAAAWAYPRPKRKAARIAGHVSFWKEVEVKPE